MTNGASHVELHLDAQRPEHDVDIGRKIVLEHQHVIRQPPPKVLARQRIQRKRSADDREQHGVVGGGDPQCPSPEIGRQTAGQACRIVADQYPGDEVSAEDEEQVHADPTVQQYVSSTAVRGRSILATRAVRDRPIAARCRSPRSTLDGRAGQAQARSRRTAGNRARDSPRDVPRSSNGGTASWQNHRACPALHRPFSPREPVRGPCRIRVPSRSARPRCSDES